jgi:hypothetical protein
MKKFDEQLNNLKKHYPGKSTPMMSQLEQLELFLKGFKAAERDSSSKSSSAKTNQT